MDEKERQAIREHLQKTEDGTIGGYQIGLYYLKDVPKLIEALGVAEMKKNVWVSKYTDACEQNKRLQEQIEQLRQERDNYYSKSHEANKARKLAEFDSGRYEKMWHNAINDRDDWKEKAERYEEALREEMRFFTQAGEPIEVYNIAKQALEEFE